MLLSHGTRRGTSVGRRRPPRRQSTRHSRRHRRAILPPLAYLLAPVGPLDAWTWRLRENPHDNHEIVRGAARPGSQAARLLNEWWAAPGTKMPRDDDADAVAEPKDDSLTYLVRKLRALLRSEAKDQSLRDLFEKLDKNGDKKVTAVELRKGLKDLGFRLDDDEVRDIIKYCDVDGDGEISYLEFESFVESPECKDADVQDVLDRLREIAEGQGGSIARRIEEMFEELDEDLSGDVDADEFHDGLRGLGLTLTVKEAEDITKRFPSTGKNAVGPKGPRIRYRDFVAAVRGKAPASHEAKDSQGDRVATYAVRKLAEEVERCSRTKQGDLDLAGCFRDLDADGSGTLDRTEIRDALDRVGVQLSRKELVEVMEFFGAGPDGEVPYEDFVAFALKQDRRRRASRRRSGTRSSAWRSEMGDRPTIEARSANSMTTTVVS